MESTLNRREYVSTLAAGSLLAATAQPGNAAALPFPQRMFHKGKEPVSILGLGGSHIGGKNVSDADAIRIMRTALDNGITFFDNSWDYHNGRSEMLMGKALRDGFRKKAFLMTKIDGRTKESAKRQMDESLLRLQVDSIELMQHHEVIRFDDVDRIFAADGAMEALVEAKQAGKIRYIGFTGHKDPAIHLYMLEVAASRGFAYDSIQMPLNPLDAHYRSFERKVLPIAQQKDIAVLGMKSLSSGLLLKSKAVTANECLRYALSLPTTVVITGIDSMEILQQALEIGRSFQPMSGDEVAQLLKKTIPAAIDGKFELFKTTSHYDTTSTHPEYLGGESARTISMTAP